MPMDKALRIGEFIRYLAPSMIAAGSERCAFWPADVFAVAAALLEKSGAYSLLGHGCWPPNNNRAWHQNISKSASEWRAKTSIKRPKAAPSFVRRAWQTLLDNKNTSVDRIVEEDGVTLCEALFTLVAVCDETLEGAGIDGVRIAAAALHTRGKSHRSFEAQFLADIEAHLFPFTDRYSTLCVLIHPSRLRVLPKSQTPKSGLSLRSLTHHISLCPPIDLPVHWFAKGFDRTLFDGNACNILIVPWPFELNSSSFFAIHQTKSMGWFGFSPPTIDEGLILGIVENLIEQAEQRVGRVHVVVFPELALTQRQYEHIRNHLIFRRIILIAGVAAEGEHVVGGDDKQKWVRNTAVTAIPSPWFEPDLGQYLEYEQEKHHRWRLDKSQIIRYGLANQLDPEKEWWEGIAVHDRKLGFFVFRDWLSACVLVCEDLARIDPIGRVVRAVGPDLVVALLMDGPQLATRWPAHHATVLTDDPGSSVLTVTSLGMVKKSVMKESLGQNHRNVVALWRDPITNYTEIAIPDDHNAAILTLTRTDANEMAADGRSPKRSRGTPVYAGVQFLKGVPKTI